jgi:uncharacterized protein involved in exopolysaccharide biosynthesis
VGPLPDVDAGDSSPPQGRDVWRDAVRMPSVRNLLVALVAGLILAAGAAWGVLSQASRYYSQATLLIDNPPAIAAAHDDSPIVKLNVIRLKYAALAATPAILVPAAQAAGLRLADVRKAITFPTGAALILVVGARTASPLLSQRVANAVADEIVVYVEHEHDQYDIPAGDRFVFTVVGRAYPGSRVSPSWSKADTAAIASGFGGLAVAYIVLQLVDGVRRGRG